MPRQATIALVGGLAVGITLGTIVMARAPGVHAALLLINVLPPVGCTIVAAQVIRQWLNKYATQCRRDRDAADSARRLLLLDLTTRQEDIERREEALNRSTAASEARVEQALRSLAEEMAAHERLKVDYAELSEDFNAMVHDTLRQNAHRFRPRPVAPRRKDGSLIRLSIRPRKQDDEDRQPRDLDGPAMKG